MVAIRVIQFLLIILINSYYIPIVTKYVTVKNLFNQTIEFITIGKGIIYKKDKCNMWPNQSTDCVKTNCEYGLFREKMRDVVEFVEYLLP